MFQRVTISVLGADMDTETRTMLTSILETLREVADTAFEAREMAFRNFISLEFSQAMRKRINRKKANYWNKSRLRGKKFSRNWARTCNALKSGNEVGRSTTKTEVLLYGDGHGRRRSSKFIGGVQRVSGGGARRDIHAIPAHRAHLRRHDEVRSIRGRPAQRHGRACAHRPARAGAETLNPWRLSLRQVAAV